MRNTLRGLEHASIRAFLAEWSSEYLDGRVLDYGCGKMPYADIVREAGGEYHPFDRAGFPANASGEDVDLTIRLADKTWDAILVTQVLQYVPNPSDLLAEFFNWLVPGGSLVITGRTNWPVVEPEDLMGLTPNGIRTLLEIEGFVVIKASSRAEIEIAGEKFCIGYGAVARRPRVTIYALSDPSTGERRYVGQTTTSMRYRLKGHMAEAKGKTTRPLAQWIKSLEGTPPQIEPLQFDPPDANVAEKDWYVSLLREGCDLVNLAVGNKGQPSSAPRTRKPMSQEQRAKVSAQMKGVPKSAQSNIKRSVAKKART